MSSEWLTKDSAAAALQAAQVLMKALPKTKVADHLAELNDLLLFLENAQRAANT